MIYVQWMDWDEGSSDNNCWWKRSKGSSQIQPYYCQDHCLLLDLQWNKGCHEVFDSYGSIVLTPPCSWHVAESAKSWQRIKVDQGSEAFELLSSNVIDSDAPWLEACTSDIGTPQCLEWNEKNGMGDEHFGFERVADSYYCYAPWMWTSQQAWRLRCYANFQHKRTVAAVKAAASLKAAVVPIQAMNHFQHFAGIAHAKQQPGRLFWVLWAQFLQVFWNAS